MFFGKMILRVISHIKELIYFLIIMVIFSACSVFKANKCDCPKWSIRKDKINNEIDKYQYKI